MTKKALLIGIDEYENFGMQLKGCENDVKRIFFVLRDIYNFPGTSITVKINRTAKKGSILYGLNTLIEDAQSGDLLVFYYSGHGAQVDTLKDSGEIDYKDEVLCPWNFDSSDPNTYIRDKELLDIFSNVPDGVNLEVIIDCCFSGGMERDASDGSTTRIRRLDLETTAPPDIEVRRFLASSSTATRDAVGSDKKFILWAACSENQKAKEQKLYGVIRGVFTYYFCKKIEDSGGGLIRSNLSSELQNSLKKYDQNPSLYCRNASDLGRTVFS